MKKINNEKGISLIAFVITLIIILIIFGVILFIVYNSAKAKTDVQVSNNNEKELLAKKDNSINLSSPKEIFSTNLPNSGDIARPSRIYKASSLEFNKNNTNKFNQYFIFEENIGWTVKRSGLYAIQSLINAVSYNDAASGIISNININGTEYEIVRDYYTGYQPAVNSAQYVTYLNEGDIIDFSFTFNAACNYNYNNITVYAMFE